MGTLTKFQWFSVWGDFCHSENIWQSGGNWLLQLGRGMVLASTARDKGSC